MDYKFNIFFLNYEGGKVNEVPVIRVFGSTPAGQKTCLHIHRVRSLFFLKLVNVDCYCISQMVIVCKLLAS